jgi:hypothetical protein
MPSKLDLITTWDAFRHRMLDPLRSRVACRLGGELLPSRWTLVDPMELLSQAREEPKARILRQAPADRLDLRGDCSQDVRAMSLQEAAEEPYLHLSLFDLSGLRQPGRVLHRFSEEVIQPLEQLWRESGVRWEGSFWPILFIGGSRSATNYHIDPTPNAIFHLFGAKRFYCLKQPDQWCPQSVKDAYLQEQAMAVRPEAIQEADCLVHDNSPGDVVWTPLLSPHWVNAGSLSATITFAFRDFRLLDGPAE